jgi:hypothetical protein
VDITINPALQGFGAGGAMYPSSWSDRSEGGVMVCCKSAMDLPAFLPASTFSVNSSM